MTSQQENDEGGFLYLHLITVEMNEELGFSVKLSIDGSDVQLTKNNKASSWTPAISLEVSETSKIIVTIRAWHQITGIFFGREEIPVEIDVKEAIQQVMSVMEPHISVSETLTVHGQSMKINVHLYSPPTMESVRSALRTLEAEMKGYRHLMKDSTSKNLDTIAKYGVAFSEMNPYAKAAFSVVSVTLTLLKEQNQRDQMISGLVRQLERVLPMVDKALGTAVKDNMDILRRTVERLFALTLDVSEFACEYVKQSRFKRMAKSIVSTRHQRKIDDLVVEFGKLMEDFDRAASVETLNIARNLEEMMLLDRLQPVPVGFDPENGCMEGTRVALLESILEWALRPLSSTHASSNIYWIYGIPGIGKTALAHSLCHRLLEKGRMAGSFFCRRDDPKLADPSNVLPTLVYKLAKAWEPYGRMVTKKLRENAELMRHSANSQLFSQLLGHLNHHPSYSLVLVIDAVDECGDIQQCESILTGLFDASLQVNWLRIIITSRQEKDMENFFKRFHGTGRYLVKDLEKDGRAEEDIRLFVQTRLGSIARKRYLPEGWPGNDRTQQIVMRSGGLFIFVETLWRMLKERLDPEKPLTQALSNASGDALGRLYSLYSTAIIARVGQDKEIFRSAMRTILAAGQPLPDNTVADLAGLPSHVVKTLVDELGSLLYRDNAINGGIRVRHLSVIDFLTGSTCPEELRVDMVQAHYNLGVSCIERMAEGLRFNICGIESSFVSNGEIIDLRDRIHERIPDALQYSCLYWSNHLCYAPDTGDRTVHAALYGLTDGPRLLYWMEVLSLMGKVSVGDLALRRTLSWAKGLNLPFLQLMNDALRFLLSFRTAIATSAPHIYVSGLPFTPTDTELWRNASASFKNLLKVKKGRLRVWSPRANILSGHTSSVKAVVYSLDGCYIASGSDDMTIQIWDVETGAPVGEPLVGHTEPITNITYSPDGRYIASGSADETIRVWDVDTGAPFGKPLTGHADLITSVAYSPDGHYIASGSWDETIRIWDADTGEQYGEPLVGHTDGLNSVAYSPNGRYIASGSDDMTVQIWDVDTRAPLGEPLTGHTGPITSVIYSPDGQYIASGSDDKTIQTYNVKTRALVGKPFAGHTDSITSIAYSPDGHYLASGSYDGTIRIWDVEKGELVDEPFMEHTDSTTSVAYSPGGHYIASGSADETIRIWDVQTRAPAGEPLMGHTHSITSVSYSPCSRFLASGSLDKIIRIWDVETGALIGEPLIGHADPITSVSYSPDGRYIASGSYDSTIRLWDVESWASVGKPLTGHTNSVTSLAYSPDGRLIASASGDKTVRIWNVEMRKPAGRPFKGHSDCVNCVAYSPDGRYLASGSDDQTIRIWDVETGLQVSGPLIGHTDCVTTVTYSPNGRRLASGSYDDTIRVWDTRTGEQVAELLTEYAGSITSVAYSPDGHFLVSGSVNETIQIWDAVMGVPFGEPLMGHTNWITSVAYSPDGRYLASGSYNETIRFWEVATLLPGTSTVNVELDSNGWSRHRDGGLAFWVPGDCRNGLMCPAVLTIPSDGRHRVVRLDFSEFVSGTSWADIKREGD